MNSKFEQVLHDHHSTATQLNLVDTIKEGKVEFELDAIILGKWKRAIAGRVASRGSLGDIKPDFNSLVEIRKGLDINGKRFTSSSHHNGNSQVEFFLGKDQRFGQIQMIYLSPQTAEKMWLVIKPYKEVKNADNPYWEYPDLNCRLVQAEYEAVVVIDSKDVIGHAAILKHQKGTFGIKMETLSAVGLGTSVSERSRYKVC